MISADLQPTVARRGWHPSTAGNICAKITATKKKKKAFHQKGHLECHEYLAESDLKASNAGLLAIGTSSHIIRVVF